MATVHIDDNLREIQGRFRLTEEEIDRAFQRARRRTVAAGYDRSFRQLKRITGEGKPYWLPNRVFSSLRHTGEGKVWVGLNPERRKGRIVQTFPDLPQEFDAEAVRQAMEQIFEAELEKAAIQAVSR